MVLTLVFINGAQAQSQDHLRMEDTDRACGKKPGHQYDSTFFRAWQSKQRVPSTAPEEDDHLKAFHAILEKIPELKRNQFREKLLQAEEHELAILADIINLDKKGEHLDELLNGAHVRIFDGGKLYKKWSRLALAKECVSSHPHDGKQFGIYGKLLGQFLYGKLKNFQGRKISWFQLERNPFNGQMAHKVLHGCDYVLYKMTGKNIGPYGKSKYVDTCPLIFSLDEDPPSERESASSQSQTE